MITLSVSLGVSTVESNQDRDRECPLCWDHHFQVLRLSISSRSTFFFSVKIFKIKIFRSRFIFVEIFIEIFETDRDCQDFRDLSRLFEVLKDQISWQMEKSRLRNVIKLTNSRSRSRQTVEICQKYHVSTDFSIETFGTGRWCQGKIEISQSRYLDHQD
jgi:hypothetical protein